MSEELFNENIKYICESIREWKDHPKNGIGRSYLDLVEFQKVWDWLTQLIKDVEKMDSDEQEIKDFIELVKYEGELYRYHIRYDESDDMYGIRESDYCVSWTKSDTPLVFYWAYEDVDYLRIKSTSTNECFGIDLVGFSKYIQMYFYENYTIGTPAILKEQEVVFPLKMNLIKKVEVVNK